MAEWWTHLEPLRVTVCVHAEARQDDQATTHLHVALEVQQGAQTWVVDEVLPVAVTLPLLDAAVDRLKEEVRCQWRNDQL